MDIKFHPSDLEIISRAAATCEMSVSEFVVLISFKKSKEILDTLAQKTAANYPLHSKKHFEI